MERIPTSLDYLQIGSLALWLNRVLPFAQLQEVWTNGRDLVLCLYNRQEFYLRIDTARGAPKIGIFLQRPPVEKKSKPLSLFLNSHAKNLRLEKSEVSAEWGRVLRLVFVGGDKGEKKVELDLLLIPRACNLIARLFEKGQMQKQISWEKPKELPQSLAPVGAQEFPDIDWLEFSKKIFNPKEDGGPAVQASSEKSSRAVGVSDSLKKKQGILLKLEKNFEEMDSRPWLEIGELLKSVREVTDIPEPLRVLFDPKLSLKQNREKAFAQYKQIEEKKLRVQDRIREVKKEVRQLEDSLSSGESTGVLSSPPAKGLLERSGAQGRRLEISPQIFAVIGKSGKDNLNILRRAQPWDLWIHLKDFPGAHAIISRPRQHEIGPALIDKVARWVIKESFNSKKISLTDVFEVLVVETRFVKPIKGDKLGRVTYQNPRVYRVRLQE